MRADVGRLPFATGSVAALHAGAALHCWPNPAAAFAEISRVLAPGGVLVASTFLNGVAPLGQVVGDSVVRPLAQVGRRGVGVVGSVEQAVPLPVPELPERPSWLLGAFRAPSPAAQPSRPCPAPSLGRCPPGRSWRPSPHPCDGGKRMKSGTSAPRWGCR